MEVRGQKENQLPPGARVKTEYMCAPMCKDSHPVPRKPRAPGNGNDAGEACGGAKSEGFRTHRRSN
jgi:hypothetical protein